MSCRSNKRSKKEFEFRSNAEALSRSKLASISEKSDDSSLDGEVAEYDPPPDHSGDEEVGGAGGVGAKNKLSVEEKKSSSSIKDVASGGNNDDLSEWETRHVIEWLHKNGVGEDLCNGIKEQGIDGQCVKEGLTDGELVKCGARTIGEKRKLKRKLEALAASAENEGIGESPPKVKFRPLKEADRLLTNIEKKGMTCEEKRTYNTKKKMITREILTQWPEDQPTPVFRANYVDQLKKLDEFKKRLGSDLSYTYKEWALGPNAIKEMVMNKMAERRRKSREEGLTTTESEASSPESSSSSSSLGCSQTKNLKWTEYFHPELTQESCNAITLVATKNTSVKDLQMKDLLKVRKTFKLSLLRGKDKNTIIRALANSVLIHDFVKISEGADMANLKREDVTCIKELVL